MTTPTQEVVYANGLIVEFEKELNEKYNGYVHDPVKYAAHLTPNGSPFDQICTGAIKIEGAAMPVLCSSPIRAVELWKDEILKYIVRHKGCLCWRIIPELNECSFGNLEFHPTTYYSVYSRLAMD